ncbi:Substrate-specific component CbrT of predicted cobalamin ECF transporter [Streptococcus criceti]|uniref:Rod shape-determining protein MreD n=1 Tax=Streptococcus criceti HS-6 TaxID=873449 RepID=G5JT03_STRCG|nr:hypothetical protein [Streptococcus criceti]EHI74200.1 hypothetical protein STRCR_2274 [Streptococcus criceti HS-6]SUN43521.1 Substrate-specific component CbrT of predicted cobalamin ECF transporter [Streptococcus criceti]
MEISLKRLTRLALLTALCIVLREAFSGLPNVQPITAIFLVVTMMYGVVDGIILSSLTMLLTGFLLGFGEIVFRQVLTFALICLLWFWLGTLFKKLTPNLSLTMQLVTAAGLSILYGVLLDASSAVMFKTPALAYILAGLSFDLVHAASTALFYPLILSIFRRFSHEKIID